MKSFSEIIQYLQTDIWQVRRRNLSGRRALMVRVLRILILTTRGFLQGRWALRASALTYYSLLSVVPAMALVFGVAKGFGFQKYVEDLLYKNFAGQEEIVDNVVRFAQTLLENVRGGLMAGIGLLILFWAIFRILSQIEFAFNDIWGVRYPRPWGRRITDYLALIMLFPILVIISSSATVVITSQVQTIVNRLAFLEAVGPVIYVLLKILPYAVIWLLFTYLYVFMPHTKIRLKAGIIAGVIAGTLWQLFQSIYINSQIGISRYNAVYGSFAALPLFIVWLYYSWLILLFGSELSCAYQNVDANEFELERRSPSHHLKRLLGLRIMYLLVKNFSQKQGSLTAQEAARRLETPIQLVNQVLYELVDVGAASEVHLKAQDENAYQPGADPEIITIKYVVDKLEHHGLDDIPMSDDDNWSRIEDQLKEMDRILITADANKKLKDL